LKISVTCHVPTRDSLAESSFDPQDENIRIYVIRESKICFMFRIW